MLNKLHEVELFGDASSPSASLEHYRPLWNIKDGNFHSKYPAACCLSLVT